MYVFLNTMEYYFACYIDSKVNVCKYNDVLLLPNLCVYM